MSTRCCQGSGSSLVAARSCRSDYRWFAYAMAHQGHPSTGGVERDRARGLPDSIRPSNSEFRSWAAASSQARRMTEISCGVTGRGSARRNCVAMITRRSLASMSSTEGWVLVRYHGARARAAGTSSGWWPAVAYRQMARVFTMSPEGDRAHHCLLDAVARLADAAELLCVLMATSIVMSSLRLSHALFRYVVEPVVSFPLRPLRSLPGGRGVLGREDERDRLLGDGAHLCDEVS